MVELVGSGISLSISSSTGVQISIYAVSSNKWFCTEHFTQWTLTIYLAHYRPFQSQLLSISSQTLVWIMYNVLSSHTEQNWRHLNHTRQILDNLWKRTTSEERTKAAVPKCPLFGGSTVIPLRIADAKYGVHSPHICLHALWAIKQFAHA